jgi:hypothetical protein
MTETRRTLARLVLARLDQLAGEHARIALAATDDDERAEYRRYALDCDRRARRVEMRLGRTADVG